MKLHRVAGLLAGLCCLIAAPAALAAAPANVTVRIEGKDKTMVEEGGLRTTTDPVSKNGNPPCTGTSVAGALDRAVSGDWDGSYYAPDYFIERIRDESYPFGATPDGWTYWVNNKEGSVGMCSAELQEGDSVLFFVSRCEWDGSKCANPPVLPLELRAPATASTAGPSRMTVVKYHTDGTSEPAAGAHILGDGVDATTDKDGVASVTFSRSGTIRVKADQPGAVRSAAETVAVSAPGQPAPPPPPAPAKDTTAPLGRILGIRESQRFKRKRAPRALRGTVSPDPSGLRAVKLSLTRSTHGRCQLYSPTKERFRRSRCGRRVNFSIGDRQDWSYLLPQRLKKGRYVFDVIAVDKAGNRDRLARGRSRVVFFVR